VPPELPPYRVLIAFDKLKDALSAEEACAIAVRALSRSHPHWHLDVAPLSDGGEGFCRITTEALHGTLQQVDVHGPRLARGQLPRVRAPLGLVDVANVPPRAIARLALPEGTRRLALIDMAAANGLGLVPAPERDVWQSSTRGTGELLLAAEQLGADAIVLGIGGSATSDLGLGALTALGLRCEDRAGKPLEPLVPALWTRLARVHGSVRALPALRIACDVDNPLFGSRGAASVYGPQKGLASADLPRFDAEARRVAMLVCDALGVAPSLLDVPGAGAAGGLGFGLMAAGAALVPGFALVSALLDLDARLARADWVITGEGRYDSSSLAGKGPHALALAAAARARRCTVFAGSIALEATVSSGPELIAISPPGLPLELALARAAHHLEQAIERAAAGVQR
jgi:glycerate kinase